MITFLRVPGVRRNSLAETGMRTLRRLEQGHDGFRSADTRDAYVRLFQAIRYCGWSGLRGGARHPATLSKDQLAASAACRSGKSGIFRFMRLAAIAFLAALVMLWFTVQYLL